MIDWLVQLKNRLEKLRPPVTLEFDSSVAALIAKVGFDPSLGALPVRRAMQRIVEDALASYLIAHKPADEDVRRIITVSLSDAGDRYIAMDDAAAREAYAMAGPGGSDALVSISERIERFAAANPPPQMVDEKGEARANADLLHDGVELETSTPQTEASTP